MKKQLQNAGDLEWDPQLTEVAAVFAERFN
jgi:hypothetical protein